jgi:hypothetical protein
VEAENLLLNGLSRSAGFHCPDQEQSFAPLLLGGLKFDFQKPAFVLETRNFFVLFTDSTMEATVFLGEPPIVVFQPRTASLTHECGSAHPLLKIFFRKGVIYVFLAKYISVWISWHGLRLQ